MTHCIALGEMRGFARKLCSQPGDVQGPGPWGVSVPMAAAGKKFRKPGRATKQAVGQLRPQPTRKAFLHSLWGEGACEWVRHPGPTPEGVLAQRQPALVEPRYARSCACGELASPGVVSGLLSDSLLQSSPGVPTRRTPETPCPPVLSQNGRLGWQKVPCRT